jgi:hypothetical protein
VGISINSELLLRAVLVNNYQYLVINSETGWWPGNGVLSFRVFAKLQFGLLPDLPLLPRAAFERTQTLATAPRALL